MKNINARNVSDRNNETLDTISGIANSIVKFMWEHRIMIGSILAVFELTGCAESRLNLNNPAIKAAIQTEVQRQLSQTSAIHNTANPSQISQNGKKIPVIAPNGNQNNNEEGGDNDDENNNPNISLPTETGAPHLKSNHGEQTPKSNSDPQNSIEMTNFFNNTNLANLLYYKTSFDIKLENLKEQKTQGKRIDEKGKNIDTEIEKTEVAITKISKLIAGKQAQPPQQEKEAPVQKNSNPDCETGESRNKEIIAWLNNLTNNVIPKLQEADPYYVPKQQTIGQ